MLIISSLAFLCCTKKVGYNPYYDKALLDSCEKKEHGYYKNDPSVLYPRSASSPHGEFRLRFNSIAMKALTDAGKLPLNSMMPEGSLVIKDVYSGQEVSLYAFMYKRGGSWLWGEIKRNGEILHSVRADPGVCTGCHSAQGHRDLIRSFFFYP